MDRPARALVAGEDAVEPFPRCLGGPARKAEHPGQAVPGRPVRRHGVHLRFLDELEAVFDRAQEAVGDGQRGRGPGRHVAGFCQLGEGRERGAQPQGTVAPSVHELQQLYGELHVADPAPAALELAVIEPATGDDRLCAGLHRAQLGELVGAEAPGPEVLGGGLLETAPGRGVARGVAGLQERLELPGPGPSLPVGDIGGHRAHDHAGAALRAQVGVYAVGARGDGDHGACQRRVDLVGVRGDEDDVDIARGN